MNFSTKFAGALFGASLFTVGLLGVSCAPSEPQTGSQTNWLLLCSSANDCGGLECLCGVCTAPCAETSDCAAAPGSSCIEPAERGAVATCDGRVPTTGLCLPRCDEDSCESGKKCVGDVCVPVPSESVSVSLDPATKYQTLVGFGASLAYDDDTIENSPVREELLDAMFEDSGLRIVRFRNRFENGNVDALERTKSLLDGATERLGVPPTLFMTSGSPPPDLKANGQRFCTQSDVDCTLRRDADGGFDYAAFAEFWRASLEAHEAVGIVPDYVSIQNHPDWVSTNDEGVEACRFLAEEGTLAVTLPDGSVVDAEFPGYAEALEAVSTAAASEGDFSFTASEALGALPTYLGPTDPARYDAVSVIFYSVNPFEPDVALLEGVRDFASASEKPIFQTEVARPGFETALLLHHALVSLGSSAFLQGSYFGSELSQTSTSVVGTDGTTVARLPVFHALAHFARYTEPGWRRIAATTTAADVLSSAWLSPDEDAMTVVLVNKGLLPVEVVLGGAPGDLLDDADLVRTTFDGLERSVPLGRLASDRSVRVPARAVVTVTTPR